MQTRRERLRQMTLDEIKSLSWEAIAEQGIEKLTVNGIARRMGMTPPAFYRYYKSRDALIKELITDAYDSFRHTLETARDTAEKAPPRIRLQRVFTAYRDWALANPDMFALFAGRKVYGFDPKDPQIIARADRVYGVFIDLYREAWEKGAVTSPPPGPDMPPPYENRLKAIQKNRCRDLPLEVINQALAGACLIHGMISMEISGRMDGFTGDPGLFYDYQVAALMTRLGMDLPTRT